MIKISLVLRVALGFALTSVMMLAMASFTYISNTKTTAQIEYTATTLGHLLDNSNTLLLSVQDANRAMMQHSNASDKALLSDFRQNFNDAVDNYNKNFQAISNSLKTLPEFQSNLDTLNTLSQDIFAKSEDQLDLDDQIISTREQAVAELEYFNGEWLFFEQDVESVISDARRQNAEAGVWDLEFILNQSLSIQSFIQQALIVDDPDRLKKTKETLMKYLEGINAKVDNLSTSLPTKAENIKQIVSILNRAIAEEQGLFQQHQLYVELTNTRREEQAVLANAVNLASQRMSVFVSTIRETTDLAVINAKKMSSKANIIGISIFLISLLISILVGSNVYYAIRFPLIGIMKSLDSIARGDLSKKIETKYSSEMGMVASHINRISDQLSQLISKVQESAVTIKAVSQETFEMTQQTNQDVASQKEQTDSVATAVTQMESAVLEVASNAEHTSTEVASVTYYAQQNIVTINENVEFVEQLKTSLDDASTVINELSADSHKIGEVLAVIQGIAEQTNLLALNAAIEAARAGEQGRGFAVVADEVRTLATRSQSSADEINQMITALQENSKKAVSIVEDNVIKADLSVEKTQATHRSLNKMVTSLELVNDMSQTIATASEEQSLVAKEVSQNIIKISNAAENIAEHAEAGVKHSNQLNSLSTNQIELINEFTL